MILVVFGTLCELCPKKGARLSLSDITAAEEGPHPQSHDSSKGWHIWDSNAALADYLDMYIVF